MNGTPETTFAVDTETTGLHYWDGDYPFVITFSDYQGNTGLARLAPGEGGVEAQLGRPDPAVRAVWGLGRPPPWLASWRLVKPTEAIQTMEDLWNMICNPEMTKVYHNAKFDVEMLKAAGWPVAGLGHDTMILARLVFPDAKLIGLKVLARWLLKADTSSEFKLKEWMKQHPGSLFTDVPEELLLEYALDDAKYTMALYRGLFPKLQDQNQRDLYYNERKLCELVGRMEARGMLCDIPYAKAQAVNCREWQARIQLKINEIVGYPINVNSSKQLAHALFYEMRLQDNLTVEQRRHFGHILQTKSGAWSTARNVLKLYDHPLIHLVMDMRMLDKMAGTYFEKFVRVTGKDGAIHPSFWQAGTKTGRFSSRDPSFHTIPSVKSGRLLDFDRHETPDVRRALISRPGYNMYAPDYSQVELRVAAFYSRDENMCAAFNSGEDIHTATTKAVFPDDWIDPDGSGKVDPAKRSFCKMVNFGVLYGVGLKKLITGYGIPESRAVGILSRYFGTYPGLKTLMHDCQRSVVTTGGVVSAFGRRFRCDPQKAYKGLNYLVQGTAADIMKYSMVRVDEMFTERDVDAHEINTVHDEIMFEVREKDDTPEFHKEVKRLMEDWSMFAPIPIVVCCKQCLGNWSDSKEVW